MRQVFTDINGDDVRVRLRTVFREHGRDDVHYDIQLRLVGGSHVDEHIARIQGDFAMLGVNDRWHRRYTIFGVVDDGVDRRVADDGQVFCEMFLFLNIC